MIPRLATLALVVVATAVACDSSSSSCAPEGTYAPTVSRSADPGSCPLDMAPVIEWKYLEVGPNDHACGSDTIEVTGSRTGSSGGTYCAYEGTVHATASSNGIAATAKLTFHPCASANLASCTANYDIAYTRL